MLVSSLISFSSQLLTAMFSYFIQIITIQLSILFTMQQVCDTQLSSLRSYYIIPNPSHLRFLDFMKQTQHFNPTFHVACPPN